jgi:predicted O-methyltransferase YrrM
MNLTQTKRDFYFMAELVKAYGRKPISGAEIGVYAGDHARMLLGVLNLQRLYLIDPYNPDDPDFAGHCKPKLPAAKEIAHRELKLWEAIIRWYEVTSDQAVHTITELLDFVYIDGNHSYDYVRRDIDNYLPLVRPGGFIGGHDYMMRGTPEISVKAAVDDYVAEHNLTLHVSEGQYPEWWIRL